MQTRYRPIILGTLSAIAIVFAVCFSRTDHPSTVSADTLKSAAPLKWYRGNMHTHSLWSDGDDYLEMIAQWYRDHNYDFLCFTDHNVLANRERWIDVDKVKNGRKSFEKLKAKFPDWTEERMKEGRHEVRLRRFDEVVEKLAVPGQFLLIQGEEVSDKFGKLPIHLNAHNVREVILPRGGESVYEVIQNNVDSLAAQRERTGQSMIIHLNHPNFGWGVAAEDLMRVRGENFFEVYNGHPDVHNDGDEMYASTERIWDIINSMRLTQFDLPLLYGLATDDGHYYHNIPSRASEPGRGWVNVLAAELTPASLIENMEAGRFYASSGVTLDEITSTKTSLSVVVRPDSDATYRIDFIGTASGFDPNSEPYRGKDGKKLAVTRKYSSEIGQILKSVEGTKATYEYTGKELYVRARITSSRKHPNPSARGEFERAWTQPVRP